MRECRQQRLRLNCHFEYLFWCIFIVGIGISTFCEIGTHKYIVLLLFMNMKYDFIVVHLSNENGLAEKQRNANKMFTSLSEIKTDPHTLAFSRFDANISILKFPHSDSINFSLPLTLSASLLPIVYCTIPLQSIGIARTWRANCQQKYLKIRWIERKEGEEKTLFSCKRSQRQRRRRDIVRLML